MSARCLSRMKLHASQLGLAVMIIAAPAAPATAGSDPDVGPQIRIDLGGGTSAANETTAAASDLFPNVVVAGRNDRPEGVRRLR